MKINFFDNRSPLFDFRWFIIALITGAATLFYYDYSGRRIFAPTQQNQAWSSSGPGYHK